MAKNIGKNSNTNDTATLSAAILVDGITSTKILDALVGPQPRIKVIVTNNSNFDVWIKLQAASVDNDKKGFLLFKNTTSTIMEDGDTYIGEISAICDIAATANIYVTDY